MQFISKLIVGAVTLTSLFACENGSKNVAANNSNSAQKAAEDYSKTFKQLPIQQAKINQHKTVSKKPTTENAGIAGIPKEAVNSAKSVVNEAKEVVGTAIDKVSEAKKAVVKATTGKEPEEEEQKENGKPAKSVISAQDAANETSKTGGSNIVSDIQSIDKNNPKINLATKKNTESVGIVGIPKEAVNSAKSVIEDTKEITKEVVDKVSSASKAVVENSKSEVVSRP